MSSSVRWQLKPLQPHVGLEGAELSSGLTLGRDPSNEVVIPAERFPHVSSHHARIVEEAGSYFVEDLGSRNGTLVNGEPVERAALSNGTMIQLGDLGPRFVVVSAVGLDQTVPVPAVFARPPQETKTLGQTTIVRLQEALGVEEGGVRSMVSATRRKNVTMMALVAAVVVLATGAGFWYLREQGRAEIERLREQNDELRSSLQVQLAENRDLAHELQSRVTDADARRAEDRAAFTSYVAEVQEERDLLEERFRKLEEDETSSQSELGSLREQLDEATERLSMFDPVNLEALTLSEVERVRRSVVLIETKVSWRESETGATLYLSTDEHGDPTLTIEEGDEFTQESTGSGFCVSKDGWIVTNAHVVSPAEAQRFPYGELELVPHVDLTVVFSGEETRHSAVLWEVEDEDEEDLALIKLEPFEGMPHLESFEVGDAPPAPGSEVYLFGFPLGTHALQEGERVIASTFKGILSRVVEPYLQVDAGVHPGNSGGPVTDASGRVVGVVTAGQRLPEGDLVFTIGYAIPIHRVGKIWPPRDEPE